MKGAPLRTSLYQSHISEGANMVDFHGYEFQYGTHRYRRSILRHVAQQGYSMSLIWVCSDS